MWVVGYHDSNAKCNISIAFRWNKSILTTAEQKEVTFLEKNLENIYVQVYAHSWIEHSCQPVDQGSY